jgi:hypothetical protein
MAAWPVLASFMVGVFLAPIWVFPAVGFLDAAKSLTHWDLGTFALCVLALGFAVSIFGSWTIILGVKKYRDQGVKASSGERDSQSDFVACMVGDEASFALATAAFAQWTGRRITKTLFSVIAILPILRFFHVISSSWGNLVVDIFTYGMLSLFSIGLLIFTSAYGLVQGLIGLDSSVTVAPSPVGKVVAYETIAWSKNAASEAETLGMFVCVTF